MSLAKGLVYIFTGDGKGKTSAALGMAVRAVCAGLKVGWVAWYKEASWDLSEKKLVKYLPIDFYFLGKGFFLKGKPMAALATGGNVVDKATKSQHQEAAQVALQKAQKLLTSQKYNLLVCDEINNAIHDKLVPLSAIKTLLQTRGKTHVVLTGRDAPHELVALADLVTKMKKIKHPYDKGKKAVKGLDF